MTITPDLIKIVLEEFQVALKINLNHSWELQHGHAPKYGYIEQTEWTENETGKLPGVSAWHISATIIRECSVKETHSPNVDGIFYDQLHGWFYFATDLSTVYVNWSTGPRFGRGFRHRIGIDTLGEYLLDRGAITWVS